MFMLLFRAVIGLTKSLVSSLFLQAALQVNFFLLMAEFPWQIQLLCSIRAPVYDPTLARLKSRDPKIVSKLFKQTLRYVEDSKCLGLFYLYLLVDLGNKCHSVFIRGSTSLIANNWGGHVSCMICLQNLNFIFSTVACFLWNIFPLVTS